ncbi:hypothetical protein [Flavobacterium praedii]|uniref:hypothetical protein n=1 Tax=Flavobacterium praedii TaxID=3002900 RepID=UPI0024819DE0|nr:hypothetical protein [Flavobacterium praedii]
MILPFSTQLNGKPTYFVEKILRGIEIYKAPINLLAFWKYTGYDLFSKQDITPKLHTIREDKTDRWKPGTKIDFFINCRQPTMFRFAPVLPVVSVQEIEFREIDKYHYIIVVDGRTLGGNDIRKLAINDGFDCEKDFLEYFPVGFKGKIIHWTDLKY